MPAAAIERAAINGLVFGRMLQLAMAFLPPVTDALLDVPSRSLVDVPARIDASFTAPPLVQVATVNLGLLALWLTPIPQFGGFGTMLGLAGYTLIAVAWAFFLHELWGVITRELSGLGAATP